jgi:hypothetical protein
MSKLKLYEDFVQSLSTSSIVENYLPYDSFLSLLENDLLDQKIKNPVTDRMIKVSSALGYDKNTDVYKAAKDFLKKNEKPAHDPDKEYEAQDNGYMGPKDKTLANVDTLKEKAFTVTIEPSDAEFAKKNKKSANPIPPEPYKLPADIFENPKFPKKYAAVLERMMNTKPSGDATKWGHYSDQPGGAGAISAQAGEIMGMMGVSMNDKDFEKLQKSMLDHEKDLIEKNPKLKPDSQRVINKSWITAAGNNRKAILNRIKRDYPGAEVTATCWDTKDEVEALGLKDYEKNKGFSSDIYVKIKTKDGKEILNEVSLKKSDEVNFLNSGAGKFSEWDKDLPDNINQNMFKERQRKELIKTGKKIEGEIKRLLDSDKAADKAKVKNLLSVMKTKGHTFEDALKLTEDGKGKYRDTAKVVLEGAKTLAEWPTWPKGEPKKGANPAAVAHLRKVSEQQTKFQDDSIEAIAKNPKMTEGMLNEIKKEFPLKSVSEGEETMAIGKNSLDRVTLKKIFGTDDFKKIKENFVSLSGPEGSYLGYRAKVGDEVIKIAKISIREDGVGYGGQLKFEMKLDKSFANLLTKANEA